MRYLLRTCIVSLLIILATTPADAGYVRRDEKLREIIVFVHGVTGNAYTSWQSADSGLYWPDLVRDDAAFASANIYVHEYPTPSLSSAPSISELADHMKLRFESDELDKHERITFVAHSMGGIVSRAFMVRYRDWMSPKKVLLMYFFATPTNGSEYAKIMALASRNPQFRSLSATDADAILSTVVHDWLAAGRTLSGIPSFCAYETRDPIIVDRKSALGLCNETGLGIYAGHVDIVKPKNKDADAYRALRVAYLAKRPPASAPPIPALAALAPVAHAEPVAPTKNANIDEICDRKRPMEFLANNGVIGSRPAQERAYEERVLYSQRGEVSSKQVIKEARAWETRYPERVYEINERTVKVEPLKNDRCLVMFEYKVSVTNQSGEVRCGARNTVFILNTKDGNLKVREEFGHNIQGRQIREDCTHE